MTSALKSFVNSLNSVSIGPKFKFGTFIRIDRIACVAHASGIVFVCMKNEHCKRTQNV
jgi:hypothetical protein